MTKQYLMMVCLAGLLTLGAGCQNKEKAESGYNEYEKPETSDEVVKMKDYHYSAFVEMKGKKYAYDIVREANDTMPTVTDDAGERYADNYIRLRINQGDRQIFNRLFTKNSFKKHLGKDFSSKAILEGMAFDKAVDKGLRFSASVSYPNSDIFIPFSITVTPDGSCIIAKDEVLDTVVEDTTKVQDTNRDNTSENIDEEE